MDNNRYVPLTIGKDGVVLGVGHCTPQATEGRCPSISVPIVCFVSGFLMGLLCGWLMWH
jgi:hypothetical protein